jgi:hypothetical protein
VSAELTITGTAQRAAWLRRVMPAVEQLEADLWSLPVPIPDNPLRYVSVYAFGTGEGLVLIDAGTMSGGWPNCSPRSATAPAPAPGSWPGT